MLKWILVVLSLLAALAALVVEGWIRIVEGALK